MGNAESNVTSGVKKQAGGVSEPLYSLVDLKGGGILIDLCKQATTTKNYAALDEAIRGRLEPFLYNNGKGQRMHVSKLVLERNKDRPKSKQLLSNEEDFDTYVEPIDPDPTMYRDVCWDLSKRGSVGESCLHLCLLSASSVHAELAKRLIRFYPKLINDVYMSDEYYGENVLHMAIVNEDPSMVKFLLDNNVNYMQRCYGAFMSPEDQKGSRTDSFFHEWVDSNLNTDYDGYVYWGEYPASFAACLEQEECYRLILAKGADPDAQDTNGNTVLHILVIHNKQNMFDMAYELGAKSKVFNKLGLTPMTLAAKLPRKELFFHIMNIEREIYWQIGSIVCAAYPLASFDTIDTVNGGILKESALNLIVFGEKVEHLDLLEGPVLDLLHAKWNKFVKLEFYRQFICFTFFFLLSTSVFVRRPIHKMGKNPFLPSVNTSLNGTDLFGLDTGNFTRLFLNDSDYVLMFNGTTLNGTMTNNSKNVTEKKPFRATFKLPFTNKSYSFSMGKAGQCFVELNNASSWSLVISECFLVLGALCYLLGAARECSFLGPSMFFENLATVPSRVIFLTSCILVHVMVILRMFCLEEAEDLVSIVVMITTAPFFLFFCRGFKTVGPFVVMIYRMIIGDLLRFVTIYLVFVMGFSQAFYIIFLSFSKADTENPLSSPPESVIAMFMMSLSSFDSVFENFDSTAHPWAGKTLFVLYMILVAILLINMLIAMMGNTYTKIAETKNEWQRQWARIVLVVERGVAPAVRHAKQGLYCDTTGDNQRVFVLQKSLSQEEQEEMQELVDVKRYHLRAVERRKAKIAAAEEAAAAEIREKEEKLK